MYSFPNPKTWKIVKPKSAKYPCDILRELRRNANLTQKELAQDLGVPQSHISQYELGQRNIPRNKAKLLGGIFGCSAKDFLNEI
jgi:transcriptional regulator with XRE-family HTH domain